MWRMMNSFDIYLALFEKGIEKIKSRKTQGVTCRVIISYGSLQLVIKFWKNPVNKKPYYCADTKT